MTTNMRYFQNAGKTYGYDGNDPTQEALITAAIDAKWPEVTGSWPPALTAAQQLGAQAVQALGAPVSVASTSTPAINGNYTITQADQSHLNSEVVAIMLNGTFTDGTSSIAWPDADGVVHQFSVAEFKPFATAIGAYVAALYKVLNGTLSTLPSAALTIA